MFPRTILRYGDMVDTPRRTLSSLMLDDGDNDLLEFNLPDTERVYVKYLETCRRLGVEPVSHERAVGLIQEWSERLSGRPEPTRH